MSYILAVIPARSGSKGLPGKNKKLLGDEPLVYRTIEAASFCPFIDTTVVSTDDSDVSFLSASHCDVLLRPSRLGKDHVPLAPVVIHALRAMEKMYKRRYEVIITLQPTSPLRNHGHVAQAWSTFVRYKGDSLISVVEEHHSIWDKRKRGVYIKPMVYHRKNRQQVKPVYVSNGAIFITKRNVLLKKKDRIGSRVVPYIMDHRSSLDIHTQDDFDVARLRLGV